MDPTLRRISIPFGFVVPLHSTLRWKEQPSLLKLKSQTSMLIYTCRRRRSFFLARISRLEKFLKFHLNEAGKPFSPEFAVSWL